MNLGANLRGRSGDYSVFDFPGWTPVTCTVYDSSGSPESTFRISPILAVVPTPFPGQYVLFQSINGSSFRYIF